MSLQRLLRAFSLDGDEAVSGPPTARVLAAPPPCAPAASPHT